jgi:hypothetical protein
MSYASLEDQCVPSDPDTSRANHLVLSGIALIAGGIMLTVRRPAGAERHPAIVATAILAMSFGGLALLWAFWEGAVNMCYD